MTEQHDGEADERGLDLLLDFLRANRGFEFGGYKRASLGRRIVRRMQLVRVHSFGEYLDYLQVHPDEFQQLFNAILINVTSFFRDGAVWQSVAEHVAALIAQRGPDEPIRVWSAGCASGEEAYTLAIQLAELLGIPAFLKRVKIYATDVDDDALGQARLATYSDKAMQAIEPALGEKYFSHTGGSWVFNKELRRSVIFGAHDLLQDAPISRVDLLTCRNTLMYFNAEAQSRILHKLQFALANGGLLFLGKAEMLLTHASLFAPVDLKLRLFTRATRGKLRADVRAQPFFPPSAAGGEDDFVGKAYRTSFESDPFAKLVVDPTGHVRLVNIKASLFGLSRADVGRPFQDLDVSYRPADLRSLVRQVQTERRAIRLKDVERTLSTGETVFFDIDIEPLAIPGNTFPAAQIMFIEGTRVQQLQGELKKAALEIQASHEELQSTSEELETTNEELQSTVEELETTNEELQSTNEELETMNEELQSTNEELQTMNDELRDRGNELNRSNAFLGSVLASLQSGVAVLDSELLVRAWNHKMEELWGLRHDEVLGKNFLNLDIGLPIEKIRPTVRASLAAKDDDPPPEEQTLECTNRRGRTIRCRISVAAMREDLARGAILIIEEVP